MKSQSKRPPESKPQWTETSPQPERISKESVALLWVRMAALFGRQWETSYGSVGEPAYLTWEEALTSNYTTENVRSGYNVILEEGNEFPPNMIKFLRLCRTVDPYSDHKKVPALPTVKPRHSVRRIELLKMQFLYEMPIKIPECPVGYVEDWTEEDEAILLDAMSQFTPQSELADVNRVIDYIEFSHGTQRENAYGNDEYDF